ncbi:MAG: DUF4382 domain-containing protein [Nitrospirae bacterium]|nr:DUF4382 domain-containing protein [Nitrospirota bacterium]
MLKTISRFVLLVFLSLVTAAGLTACGSSGGGSGTGAQGTTALFLKDGPIPAHDGVPQIVQLWVTIKKITFESINDTTVTVYDDAVDAPLGPVDLLTLNGGNSKLITLVPVPAGTYKEAKMVIDNSPANLYFVPGDGSGNPVLDANGNPVHTPLILNDENDNVRHDGQLEFEFNPLVVVAADGTTAAMIDFVPVVTTDGNNNYYLDHDFENNESGEIENESETAHTEAEGIIAALSTDHTGFTLQTGHGDVAVAVSDTTVIEQNDVAKTMADLADGQRVEVKGALDMSTTPPTLTSTWIEIQTETH